MVMAKLHVICGNCGNNDDFNMNINIKGEDLTLLNSEAKAAVSILCQSCGTRHELTDNAPIKKEEDP